MVNIGLEGGWWIGKAHRYYHELIMAVPGPESRLPFVSSFDSEAVVGIFEVDFTKVLDSSDLVYDLIDQWQWIPVLDSNGI